MEDTLHLPSRLPGASAEAAGREITFTGTDTVRIAGGKLAEYWANAYSLLFFQQRAEEQQRQFADLAAKAGLRHLVVLSQLAADLHSPVRFLRYHAAVEQHVRELGIAYTFLRPNLFFQGLLAFAQSISGEAAFTPRSATSRSAPWTCATSQP